MDKKTFLILFYLTALLPITYMIGQLYLPNRGLIGIGLLNMITLIILFLFFATTKDSTNPKKKKFGLVLIALLVGAMLFSGVIDGFLIKGSLRLHNMFNSNSVVAPSTGSLNPENQMELTIPAVETLTGIQTNNISGSQENNEKTSGTITLEGDSDIIIQTKPQTITDETAIKKDSTTVTSVDSTKNITPTPTESVKPVAYSSSAYGSVIPYLVSQYGLKNTKKSYPKFSFVSVKNSLYSPFSTAYSKGMIGTSINPATKVSCDTYLVLKGIAAGWKVSYTGSPFAAYRTNAETLGKVNGCTKGQYVTSKTL